MNIKSIMSLVILVILNISTNALTRPITLEELQAAIASTREPRYRTASEELEDLPINQRTLNTHDPDITQTPIWMQDVDRRRVASLSERPGLRPPQAPQELIDKIAPQRNSIHLDADSRWVLNSTIPFVALGDLDDRIRANIETNACTICTNSLSNENSVVICECSHLFHLPCFNTLLNFGMVNERDADDRLLYNGTERIQYVKCPSCRAIMVPAYLTQ